MELLKEPSGSRSFIFSANEQQQEQNGSIFKITSATHGRYSEHGLDQSFQTQPGQHLKALPAKSSLAEIIGGSHFAHRQFIPWDKLRCEG